MATHFIFKKIARLPPHEQVKSITLLPENFAVLRGFQKFAYPQGLVNESELLLIIDKKSGKFQKSP